MTNTTTPSMRESFEKWFHSLSIVYQNDLELNKLLSAWAFNGFDGGYQACTALMQPKIDALEADKARLIGVLKETRKHVYNTKEQARGNSNYELFCECAGLHEDIDSLLEQMKEGK